MTVKQLSWVGLAATLALMLVLGYAGGRERSRQENAAAELRAEALSRALDLYAYNCAECHGSHGQGEIQDGATLLSDDYMANQEADWLYKAVSRGRDNSEMAAFHLDEGGAFTTQEVDSLVTLVKFGDWERVAVRVVELGMVSEAELELLAAAEQTPTPDVEPVLPSDTGDDLPPIEIVPTEGATALTEDAGNMPFIEIVPTATPKL